MGIKIFITVGKRRIPNRSHRLLGEESESTLTASYESGEARSTTEN
jgi:hypothetical protein